MARTGYVANHLHGRIVAAVATSAIYALILFALSLLSGEVRPKPVRFNKVFELVAVAPLSIPPPDNIAPPPRRILPEPKFVALNPGGNQPPARRQRSEASAAIELPDSTASLNAPPAQLAIADPSPLGRTIIGRTVGNDNNEDGRSTSDDQGKSGGGNGSGGGLGHGKGSGTGNGNDVILYKPRCVREPSFDELRPFLPPVLLRSKKSGYSVLLCQVMLSTRVRNCRVAAEFPDGSGFGEAAKKASSVFRIFPVKIDKRPVDGAWVLVRTEFDLD